MTPSTCQSNGQSLHASSSTHNDATSLQTNGSQNPSSHTQQANGNTSTSKTHNFIVGTFDSPDLYVLAFDPSAETLTIAGRYPAKGSHSWLALNSNQTRLYATCWSDPPGIASYIVDPSSHALEFLNFVPTAARSGYVAVSKTSVYSAGGPSGEVYALNEDGSLGELVQSLGFLDKTGQQDSGSVMDFGGLRHGAHSADLSPDGKTLYVADIGRNCIWTFGIDKSGKTHSQNRVPATRHNDGPRHVWPHPNGKIVYCLQEHSSYVDAFEHTNEGLQWKQGVRIIPAECDAKDFWADEVRLSLRSDAPSLLFASTRGLKESTKGYLAAYALGPDGLFLDPDTALHIWQTPTSGGWANAIEPAPFASEDDYLALTCSESGCVSIIAWRQGQYVEIAKVKLPRGGPATVQWLK